MKKILIFLQILGFATLVIGIVLFRQDVPQDERVEHLTPLTAAALATTPPGDLLLIEGHINADTVPFDNDLVAYDYGCYSRGSWSLQDKTTAPLRVTVTDGVVTINDSFYRLVNPPDTITAPEPVEERPGCRGYGYRGFGSGAAVVAIGTATSEGTIEADMLYGGTYAELLASTRQAKRYSSLGSWLMGGGIALFVLAFSLLLVVNVLGGIAGAWWKVLQGGR